MVFIRRVIEAKSKSAIRSLLFPFGGNGKGGI
jgi:hypothetical protein